MSRKIIRLIDAANNYFTKSLIEHGRLTVGLKNNEALQISINFRILLTVYKRPKAVCKRRIFSKRLRHVYIRWFFIAIS